MGKTSSGTEFCFDRAAADKAEQFFERYLIHVKGEWGGQPFVPEKWQREFIRRLFGWKRRSDGLRRYRVAYLEIPRKNGKSFLCAGIALYLTYVDGEPGAEVYSAAADRDQAHVVFDVARQMVIRNPDLSSRSEIFKKHIAVTATASRYQSVSSDADTKLGANPHGVVFDEFAVQPDRKLYDAFRTGMGARRQPLMVMLTTAGISDRTSIGWEMADYARKVRDGIIQDDEFYPLIYSADPDDDWTDERVWKKVNPNWGISVKPEFIRSECETAKASPAAQNSFRRFYLDQWVEQEERFIDMAVWDACSEEFGPIEPEELEHYECYAGLDLGSVSDLSALVLAFPPVDEDDLWEVLPYFWMPEENVRKRVEKDRVPYDQWVREGLIQTTPGNVTDQEFIRVAIGDLAGEYEIRQLGVDPWNAQQLLVQLAEDGHNVVQYRQGMVSMNAPTKELLALLMGKRIRVGENPVLRWMASNLTVKMDEAGNLKPDKNKSTEKIDGMVALIMGIGLAIADPDAGPNVYEQRAEAGEEELVTWL